MKQFEEWHKNNHHLVPESMGNIAREGWKAALEWVLGTYIVDKEEALKNLPQIKEELENESI